MSYVLLLIISLLIITTTLEICFCCCSFLLLYFEMHLKKMLLQHQQFSASLPLSAKKANKVCRSKTWLREPSAVSCGWYLGWCHIVSINRVVIQEVTGTKMVVEFYRMILLNFFKFVNMSKNDEKYHGSLLGAFIVLNLIFILLKKM